MSCEKIDLKNKKICIGDLNKKIDIELMTITPLATADFTETFVDIATVWAGIQTIKGVEIFDGTNVLGVATHNFYIKYRAGIERDNFIDYNSKRYRVLDIENQNENNEFLILRCEERGDKTTEVNWR